MKISGFHDAVSRMLSAKLQPVIAENRDLNIVACVDIYTTIFNALVECITDASVEITNEGMNYISQCYYDGIRVNGTVQGLDPEIFTQRAQLENVETKELALLAVLLNGTDFAFPVLDEIKRRS